MFQAVSWVANLNGSLSAFAIYEINLCSLALRPLDTGELALVIILFKLVLGTGLEANRGWNLIELALKIIDLDLMCKLPYIQKEGSVCKPKLPNVRHMSRPNFYLGIYSKLHFKIGVLERVMQPPTLKRTILMPINTLKIRINVGEKLVWATFIFWLERKCCGSKTQNLL